MTNIARLNISYQELELKTEVEKLFLITEHLGAIGLVASELLYCGADGISLLNGNEQKDRLVTFGAPYEKFLETARVLDTTGYTSESYPFYHAFKPRVVLPALITYDISQLLPKYPEEDSDRAWAEQWIHKDGSSVNAAVNAVVLFKK